MDPIVQIKRRLSRHPELSYVETPNEIQVGAPAEGGFSAGFAVDTTDFTVNYDGWHAHFESLEEALDCFAFGFSGQCRLEVKYRGDTPVSFTLQRLEGDSWVPHSTTGLVFRPFWRRKRVEYLQNPDLLEPE